ncbi:GNAT family N-acetyltransferase [Flavobacterium bizetiae]|uniref:GNAT family N-acetyltransferase n=1 Tax=Flavobacterium bizetiae TaxID=2704140 RepID=UPI0021E84B75|nr:GNAT family N-acetyltransferase [Flavobacterium bizetiae]UTN02716.1 GNAT family N-acetyltransferase [Flavobacterium bizetiae]
MKTLQRTIEFTGKDFVMPDPFPNKPVLVNDSLIDEAIPNFTVEIANSKHVFWVKEICDVTLSSAIARGTGISGRSPELLESKIRKGEAIIAFTSEGKWAGFSFISSWENGQYVSNSGLIVAPEFRHTGLAKTIKRKIFELSRQKYPDAKIFSLTTGLAVMKMNHELGFEPVTYSELTSDDVFWENCKSCVNCPILMSKERKNCFCTAMLYDPKNNRSLNIK